MSSQFEIVTVDKSNVGKLGFFCCKSKAKSEGYKRKQRWLDERFDEGMQMRLAIEDSRSVGFIEYIPGVSAWRAVNAEECMVIHCIWVVGRAKEKGYGSQLLEQCIEDARSQGMAGVAMVTSRSVWLAGSDLFLRHGFRLVESAPPSFDLVVRSFGSGCAATFPVNWDERAAVAPGLTVFRTDQCPYIDDAVVAVEQAGAELGIPVSIVALESAQAVREQSPTPYGTFCITYEHSLYSYSYQLKKDLVAGLAERRA